MCRASRRLRSSLRLAYAGPSLPARGPIASVRGQAGRLRARSALLAALALAAALMGCSSTRHTSGASVNGGSSRFLGAALPAGVGARDFTLTDQAGRPVSLASYRGAVTVVALLFSTSGGRCAVDAQHDRQALHVQAILVP